MEDHLQFAHLLMKRAEKDAAYERYNHAAAHLRLAQMELRLAEVICQSEPINSLIPREHREAVIKIVRWVALGSPPDFLQKIYDKQSSKEGQKL